jgi:succinate dehydrogenase / fumarate reductase flavoprotein subunit
VGEHADHVLLKLDHLGLETIEKRLPGIREIAKKFANVDPVTQPIPVVPTVHYQMGGIPTNFRGEVVVAGNALVPGFYAAGECGCASIHGANRLGTNSLTDLLVMGKSAGMTMIEYMRGLDSPRPLPADAAELSRQRVDRLNSQTAGEDVNEVRADMQRNHAGALRRLPLPGPALAGRGKDQGDRRAREAHADQGQVEGLQHRAHRGARAR